MDIAILWFGSSIWYISLGLVEKCQKCHPQKKLGPVQKIFFEIFWLDRTFVPYLTYDRLAELKLSWGPLKLKKKLDPSDKVYGQGRSSKCWPKWLWRPIFLAPLGFQTLSKCQIPYFAPPKLIQVTNSKKKIVFFYLTFSLCLKVYKKVATAHQINIFLCINIIHGMYP